MAGTSPRTPAIISPTSPANRDDFVVSELVASEGGAHSPFGPEVVFPMPVDRLHYHHPRPQDRPHLAGGR